MNRALTALALLAFACQSRPGVDQAQVEADAKALKPGFLLGTATAAHQIEGGNDNDWSDWETGHYDDGQPHIARGETSGLADDSWNRIDTDLALMKRLGTNAYRFSFEWSRLQKSKGAALDPIAVERYHLWLTKLREAGIAPMVTLMHFTLPRWVSAEGGFESSQAVADFEAFVRQVAREFGPQVDTWCTINEMNVYALEGYSWGEFPPGKKDDLAAAHVLELQLEAHARAAAALREEDLWDADGDGRATFIGLAHHVRIFQASTTSAIDNGITGLTDDFFNESIPRALITGRVRVFIPGAADFDIPVEGLAGSVDWLGLNYYTRGYVRTDLGDPTFSKMYVPKERKVSQLGWDIYPDGLYLALKRLSAVGVPLYVTENGMADADDSQRVEFLQRHLLALTRAARDGVDVRGYFHWSLLDNFEWADGFAPRFGLFKVDYAAVDAQGKQTFERTPTKAVETMRGFAKALGLKPTPD
jgi:beta-glucosidase